MTSATELLNKRIVSELKPISLEDAYNAMLNHKYGSIMVLGNRYSATTVLRFFDPPAYVAGYTNFVKMNNKERLEDRIKAELTPINDPETYEEMEELLDDPYGPIYELDGKYYDYDEVQKIINSE